MVTFARTQKPTDQTEVQHTNLGFSIRAGSQGNLPATVLWSRTCIKCNEWHEIFFLQKLWFIYLSLYSLVFVSTNGAINCPGMQKCIYACMQLNSYASTSISYGSFQLSALKPKPDQLLTNRVFLIYLKNLPGGAHSRTPPYHSHAFSSESTFTTYS